MPLPAQQCRQWRNPWRIFDAACTRRDLTTRNVRDATSIVYVFTVWFLLQSSSISIDEEARLRMAKKDGATKKTKVEAADYRHTGAKRTNIPPAKIAAEGKIPLVPKARY